MSLTQKFVGIFKSKHSKRSAFTLAEVLITLGIIGFVSAMTIPNLIANTQSKRASAIIKQDYSILQQVMLSAGEDGAIASVPSMNSSAQMKQWFQNYILPYLSVEKVCYDEPGCWTGTEKTYNGQKGDSGASAKGCGLATVSFYFRNGSVACLDDFGKNDMYDKFGVKVNGDVNLLYYIDSNGEAPPNVYGKDIFIFVYDGEKNSLYTAGASRSEAEVNANCGPGGNGRWCAQKARAAGWNVTPLP